MTLKFLSLLIFLLLVPFVSSNAQNRERQQQPTLKDQILMKLDSINQSYLSLLKGRDKYESRKILNRVIDLIDILEDKIREDEHLLRESDRIIAEKDRMIQDLDRNHDFKPDRKSDRDNYDNQDNDRRHHDKVVVNPMSFTEFNQLVSSVENTAFDQDKKKIVKSASASNYFMVDQVIKLVSKFAFDNDKLDVIELLYPRLVDLEKNYLLYNCLTFSDGKNKLEKFIDANQK